MYQIFLQLAFGDCVSSGNNVAFVFKFKQPFLFCVLHLYRNQCVGEFTEPSAQAG